MLFQALSADKFVIEIKKSMKKAAMIFLSLPLKIERSL